jgi:DNA-binding NtrC family response regulator
VLQEHEWPGNVRELRNVIERALSLDRDVLRPELLALPTPAVRAAPRFRQSGELGFFEARQWLMSIWERSYLEQLLAKSRGNISRAARQGGIDRTHLYRLLKKHGLMTQSDSG